MAGTQPPGGIVRAVWAPTRAYEEKNVLTEQRHVAGAAWLRMHRAAYLAEYPSHEPYYATIDLEETVTVEYKYQMGLVLGRRYPRGTTSLPLVDANGMG